MKKSMLILLLYVCLNASFCFSVVFANENNNSEDGEYPIAWDKLPESVQEVFQVQLGTSELESLTQEMDDEFKIYEAAQQVNGMLKEVKVGDNGQILEIEDDVSLSDLPAAVSAKIRDKSPKSQIKEVRRVTRYFYEVIVANGSKEQELKIMGNGQEFEVGDWFPVS